MTETLCFSMSRHSLYGNGISVQGGGPHSLVQAKAKKIVLESVVDNRFTRLLPNLLRGKYGG